MADDKADLAQEIKRLNELLTKLNSRLSPWRSFFGGILSVLGSIVGATIIAGLLFYFLRQINFGPLVGNWMNQMFTKALQSFQPNINPTDFLR